MRRMYQNNPSQKGYDDSYEGWIALYLVICRNMSWWQAFKLLGSKYTDADREEIYGSMLEAHEAGATWRDLGEYFGMPAGNAFKYAQKYQSEMVE